MIGLSIKEIHELLKNRKLSENDLKELLEYSKLVQEKLNPFITICDFKLKDVEIKNDNLLANVPSAIKDNITTKGVKTTASTKILEDYIPFFNASVIEKLEQENYLLIGKTALDELAMGGTTKTSYTGVCKNPYDSNRISGGSSGGSAVAVATGIASYALGTDTGDSIRKPAAYNGIVGIKPTYGVISRYGVIPYASSLDHVGIFARSVEDAAIVLDKIAFKDSLDLTSVATNNNYYEDLNENLQGKKIAILKPIYEAITNLAVLDNLKLVVSKLEELGATVEIVDFDEKLLIALNITYMTIANAEATSNHACLDGIKYGPRADGNSAIDMMLKTRTKYLGTQAKQRMLLGSYVLSNLHYNDIYLKAKKIRRLIVEAYNNILNQYDAILAPCSNNVAPLINEVAHAQDTKELIVENHMSLANFSGTPSITIPTGFIEHMPIGVNITCKAFNDQEVLNIAKAIESLLPYKNQYVRVK